MSDFAWTDERVEEARALWKHGLSASQIAVELRAHSHETLTRSAVIGKLHRLGLKRGHPIAQRKRVPRGVRQAPPPPKPPRPDAPAPIPEPSGLYRRKLVDLRNESCRFPVTAEPPHRFCGEPEADMAAGIPWCRYHARMAYRRPGEREAA